MIQRLTTFHMLNGSSLGGVGKINAINADASHPKMHFEQGVWDIESVKCLFLSVNLNVLSARQEYQSLSLKLPQRNIAFPCLRNY